MRLLPVVFVSLLVMTACHRDPVHRGGASDPAGKGGAIVSKPVVDAGVLRERRAMGRWRSRTAELPGSRDQWLIVDVAGTKDVRVEIRNHATFHEAVSAFANGKASISDNGVSVELRDAKGPLAPFARFSATFPTTSTMLLKTPDGRSFVLTFDGV